MRFRKLRVAFSVVCGIICLLLVVLWVRSYRWIDRAVVMKPGTAIGMGVFSDRGQLVFASTAFWSSLDDISQLKLESAVVNNDVAPVLGHWGFGYFSGFRESGIAAPHWFAVMIFAALASMPWAGWIGWRFSLRTLLIVTTLVAIALGLVVALR